jgi:hypothetical protein
VLVVNLLCLLYSSCISSKRRKKKKIRRILDDAELGEETRRKIAIEKVPIFFGLFVQPFLFLGTKLYLCFEFL